MITKAELIVRFRNACKSVCAAEAELTDIDAKFGDAACILCDANGLFRVTRHVLAPDPEAFITEPVIPAQRWKDLRTEPHGKRLP